MDRVVQQNAATAEESASASEEMNAQAEQMKAIVGELAAIVGNGHQKFGAGAQVDQTIRKAHRPDKPCSKDAPEIPPIQIMPEQAIPLDDRDFKVL
jgi:methyl-accepting chemotaxis protein